MEDTWVCQIKVPPSRISYIICRAQCAMDKQGIFFKECQGNNISV